MSRTRRSGDGYSNSGRCSLAGCAGTQAETFVCSLRGHCAPAAEVGELTAADAGLGVDLPDGRRMARCLRCDVWVDGRRPEPSQADWDVLPPLEQLYIPRRSRPLRDAFVTRLIAVDRGIHAVIFTLLFLALVTLDTKLGPLQAQARSLRSSLTTTVTESGRNPSRDVFVHALDRILRLHKGGLPVLAATAAAYAVVEGTEAVGLWREKRWAEYLTVIATAGFLPFGLAEWDLRAVSPSQARRKSSLGRSGWSAIRDGRPS